MKIVNSLCLILIFLICISCTKTNLKQKEYFIFEFNKVDAKILNIRLVVEESFGSKYKSSESISTQSLLGGQIQENGLVNYWIQLGEKNNKALSYLVCVDGKVIKENGDSYFSGVIVINGKYYEKIKEKIHEKPFEVKCEIIKFEKGK